MRPDNANGTDEKPQPANEIGRETFTTCPLQLKSGSTGRCPILVRSTPESGPRGDPDRGRLWATTGLMRCSKTGYHLVGASNDQRWGCEPKALAALRFETS